MTEPGDDLQFDLPSDLRLPPRSEAMEVASPFLAGIPEGCDCAWSVVDLPDGRKSGSVFIAGMCSPMHRRSFTEPLPGPNDG